MSRVLRSVTALAVTLFLAVPASARAAVPDPAAAATPGRVGPEHFPDCDSLQQQIRRLAGADRRATGTPFDRDPRS